MQQAVVRLTLAMLVLVALVCTASVRAADTETYLRLQFDSHKDLSILTRLVSIDNVDGNTAYAYANSKQLDDLMGAGYVYEVLPHPSSLIDPRMSSSTKDAMAWDVYPTYGDYVAMMEGFAASYPSICRLDTIGTSIQGRLLLSVRISDNVGMQEAEPEFLYTSSMHGDEITGYVCMLRLIDSLLVSYGTDPRITNLIDNLEIHINPAANPDGTYAGGDNSVSGATRYNANSIDLNRNYHDPEDGLHPDGNAWQQETVAFMDFAEAHSFIMAANFHGGAEVMNYPWDTWSQRHPDDDWMQLVSHEFADSAQTYSPSGYMDGFNDGISNGYDWYTISGGRQDYMNYFHGCREITMEISDTKLIPASQLPDHWIYLKQSFLCYMEQALYGIRGIVTDDGTGLPLAATIMVLSHDIDNSHVFTDPDIGDYYRPIKGGTYDLVYSAPGYFPDTVFGISVSDYSATTVDVALVPLPTDPILQFTSQNAGRVDAGDVVSFAVVLTNIGAGNATNVTATLTSVDPLVTITAASATYPTISALGGFDIGSPEFQISVDAGTPDLHELDFVLQLSGDDYTDSVMFSITVGIQLEDFESGGFTSFAWSLSGDELWTVDNQQAYDGSYSARSGAITHNDTTDLSITLSDLPEDTISFYYSVSSEATYDWLHFLIDDVEQDKWSGSIGWTHAVYNVSAGDHTFTWRYTKDGSLSSGSDAAWVDYIIFPANSGGIADKDGDGTPDAEDNCPDTYNPTQDDGDGDLIGNVCDNCADVYNPEQTDLNENGVGDACECCVGLTGNVNADGADAVDISDLTHLVNHLFVTFVPLTCPAEANTSGDVNGDVDISDLTILVNHLFVTFEDLAICK